ncbi:MAG: hypothetical protein L6R42_003891 [Xanthoria sp. 1 TBL-2021]|nr:MAG: hypothetical protein L6R42_003891 [Xanthoria sp. 1 TBL-2021]
MSRQYTDDTEGLEYHRRSNQTRETAAEYALRASPRTCPISRTSPQQDNDSDKGDQQPRRRIGLACSRCRKRKIKCSGDTGGGCKSCKSAGVEECNFLRVNSFNAPNHGLEYPYSNNSTLSLPVTMARGNSGTNSFYAGDYGMSYSSNPHRGGSVNGHNYSSVNSRQSHPSMATGFNDGSLNDEIFEHYAQAPNYMLPAQDKTSTTAYSTHDLSRQWTPITHNRPSTLSFEHDASYKYAASNFPYINSSSTPAMGPNDSLFPDMTSLSGGLPQHRDRTLPNPKRTSMSLEAGSNSYQNSGEFSSYGPPPGLSHKSSVAWSPQTQTRGGSQGSVSSTSLSAFSGSVNGSVNGSVSGPVGGSVSCSPPAECSSQTTTAFGYVPLSSSPLQQAVSMSRPSELETVNTTTGNKYRSLAQMPPMPYSLGQTSLAYRGPPAANHYGYSMTSHKPNPMTETSSSDHTLINGEPYHRLRQPPVKHNPLEPLPLDKPPPVSITPKAATATTAQQSRHR